MGTLASSLCRPCSISSLKCLAMSLSCWEDSRNSCESSSRACCCASCKVSVVIGGTRRKEKRKTKSRKTRRLRSAAKVETLK